MQQVHWFHSHENTSDRPSLQEARKPRERSLRKRFGRAERWAVLRNGACCLPTGVYCPLLARIHQDASPAGPDRDRPSRRTERVIHKGKT